MKKSFGFLMMAALALVLTAAPARADQAPAAAKSEVKAQATPAAKPAAKAKKPKAAKKKAVQEVWVCTMCHDVRADKPGKCPHCGMDLVKETPEMKKKAEAEKKS